MSYPEAALHRCPRKRYSENIQHVDGRTLMPKCDFSKVSKQVYWNHTSAWVLSCKFATYFQNTFSWDQTFTAASGYHSQLIQQLETFLLLRVVQYIVLSKWKYSIIFQVTRSRVPVIAASCNYLCSWFNQVL